MKKGDVKGQLELFGLVLIVVIAGFLTVFAFKYYQSKALNPEKPVHQVFWETEFPSELLTVLSKTFVEECELDYSDLVKDCALHPAADFESSGSPVCVESGSVKTTCHFVNKTTLNVSRFLYGKGVNHRFAVYGSTKLLEINKGCSPESEREAPGSLIIPLYPAPGVARVTLEVCS